MTTTYLPPVTATTGSNHIPTSEARPLGPYLSPPENAEQILQNWEGPDFQAPHAREFRRNRFDQFSENALAGQEVSPLQVAGQAFLISNGEPIPFWDYARSIWYRFDKHYGAESYKKKTFVMNNTVGLVLAHAAEWWGWVVGKQPAFTVFRVRTVCRHKWHNIEKARRVLGYEPIVGLDEGMQRTVDVRHTTYHQLCSDTDSLRFLAGLRQVGRCQPRQGVKCLLLHRPEQTVLCSLVLDTPFVNDLRLSYMDCGTYIFRVLVVHAIYIIQELGCKNNVYNHVILRQRQVAFSVRIRGSIVWASSMIMTMLDPL